MSIYASHTTTTLELPFDPPHTVTLRKLSGWQLGKAQKAFVTELMAEIVARGGAKAQKDMQALFEKDPSATAEVAKVQADPLNGYDRRTLITAGVTAVDDAPLEPGFIEDLSEDAIEFFAREVLRLTKPALFVTTDEAETDRKNASPGSTGS